MKILITGSKGFVGRNLVCELRNSGYTDLYEYDVDSPAGALEAYTRDCAFVFHLAGVNRPENTEEFMAGNRDFTSNLLALLKSHENKAPILLSSSIQAELENPYGQSKKAGEVLLHAYGKETGAKIYVFRLPNLFGKWCRPNYNSVVATFCHNIANGLPITINNAEAVVPLVYIDDLLGAFLEALKGGMPEQAHYTVEPVYPVALGRLAQLLQAFHESRKTLSVADMSDPFQKKLYSTYLSYLPADSFGYPLKMNRDDRGSFTEILRTAERGQFSVNISKPGIVKGNHWHHTKNEKFLVVSGNGVIRFRKIGCDEILEYFVSGDNLQVVDIPPGYTHNIENLSESDMVTFMWCNECFDPEHPDTYFETV